MEGRDNVRRRAFGYLEKTLLALFRRSPLLCARGRNVSTENFYFVLWFRSIRGEKHRGNYGEKRKVPGWKFRCRIDRFVCQRSRQVSDSEDLLKSLFLFFSLPLFISYSFEHWWRYPFVSGWQLFDSFTCFTIVFVSNGMDWMNCENVFVEFFKRF